MARITAFLCNTETLLLLFGILLPSFMCALRQEESYTYYVKPNFPVNSSCPGNPDDKSQCRLLDYYLQKWWDSNITLTLVFGKGRYVSIASASCFLSSLILFGNGPACEVILEHIFLSVKDPESVYAENLTVEDSSLSVIYRQKNTAYPHFTVNSCVFVDCVLKIEHANLKVLNSTFTSSPLTAITLYSSTITLSGEVSFINNRGLKGAALVLIGTPLMIDRGTTVLFENNTAQTVGGAIYIGDSLPDIGDTSRDCFYQLIDLYLAESGDYNLTYLNNSAVQSGDHVYGAGMHVRCVVAHDHIHSEYYYWYNTELEGQLNVLMSPDYSLSLSAVSGEPWRVCLCDDNGRPQCANGSMIFMTGLQVYPGEQFTLSAAVVGEDFGTTTGNVYANLYTFSDNQNAVHISEAIQTIDKHKKCANLMYTLLSNSALQVMVCLTVHEATLDMSQFNQQSIKILSQAKSYNSDGIIFPYLLSAPVFINISILSCPPGLTLVGNLPRCECCPVLTLRGAKCEIYNGTGNIEWNTDAWLSIISEENYTVVSTSDYCPSNFCKSGVKSVNLLDNNTFWDLDNQCLDTRIGRLCGSCRTNYSLALGSSNCLSCSNNNYIALLIFFAAAGPIIVIVISALNLTVAQGTINGLLFYANIIWAFQNYLFVNKNVPLRVFLQVFISWLNLNFGIEVCFIKGLNAFWKTWLQYVFPIYTASLFFVGLRYSSKLSKLFGSRSVPTLATLLFLSYAKFLRTIIESLQLATVHDNYVEGSIIKRKTVTMVWGLDGSLIYGHYPHIFLLLVAIVFLVLVWIPYTLLLFSMQWLRKIDHHQPLRLIAKYKPVYDAYFGPLRDKHHYWFGVLLLAQAILLIVSSLTLNTSPNICMFLLLILVTLLFGYMNYTHVYKKSSVTILESLFFINLILLTSGTMYYKDNGLVRTILTQVSISFALLEFIIIILMSVIPTCKRNKEHNQDQIQENETQDLLEHLRVPADSENLHHRESILDERDSHSDINKATY